MYISDLPVEIVSRILKYLSKEDLHECLKVCKLWYREISPICFKKIKLVHDDKNYVNSIKKTRPDSHRIGDFVESLQINSDDIKRYDERTEAHGLLSQDDFCDLISHLPYLYDIEFVSFEWFTALTIIHYLERLNETPIELLKNLNKITLPWPVLYCDKCVRLYTSMIGRFSATITTLNIVNSHEYLIEHNSLSDFLRDFKNLKTLTLSSLFNKRHEESDSMDDILSACQGLETLKMLHQLELEDFELFYGTKVHPNLKSLSMVLEDLGKPLMDYIMQYLPRLDYLELELQDSYKLEVITENKSHLIAFFEHLKRVSLVKFTYEFRYQEGSSFTRYASYWDFVRYIYEKDYHCYLHIRFSRYFGRGHVAVDRSLKVMSIDLNWYSRDEIPEGWVQDVDFLRFRRIIIGSKNLKNYSLFKIIKSIQELVQKQSHETHQIFIKHANCIVEIRPTPLRDEFRDYQTIGYGKGPLLYFRKICVDKKILEVIGNLYPNIEKIVFEKCKFQKEDPRSKEYHIDLLPFKNICHLILDLDSVLKSKTLSQTIYIQFNFLETCHLYSLDTKENLKTLVYLGPQSDLSDYEDMHKFRLYCSKIDQVTFNISGNIMPVKH